MATKTKPADTTEAKPRRVPSPNQGKRTISKPSTVGRREASPSSSMEKAVPNYLKPTKASGPEPAKTVKKPGPDITTKPNLNRRRSFDRPPTVTATSVQKALASGHRETTVKPSSSVSKSTTSARSVVDTKPKSTTSRPVSSRPGVMKTTKKASTATSKAAAIKKKSEPKNSGGNVTDHDIDVVPDEVQVDDNASPKELSDHCGETDDHTNISVTHSESELTDHDEKSVNSECPDDVHHELHDHDDVTESGKEEDYVHQEDIVPEEEIDNTDNHDQEEKIHKQEEESTTEVEATEVGEQPYEAEKKDVSLEESVAEDETESATVEAAIDQKETDEKGKTDDHGKEAEDITAMSESDEKPNAAAMKSQKSMVKRDSAVSNDVIEETKNKLLEKRKNKVSALVGAFETVIQLQEPDQP